MLLQKRISRYMASACCEVTRAFLAIGSYFVCWLGCTFFLSLCSFLSPCVSSLLISSLFFCLLTKMPFLIRKILLSHLFSFSPPLPPSCLPSMCLASLYIPLFLSTLSSPLFFQPFLNRYLPFAPVTYSGWLPMVWMAWVIPLFIVEYPNWEKIREEKEEDKEERKKDKRWKMSGENRGEKKKSR